MLAYRTTNIHYERLIFEIAYFNFFYDYGNFSLSCHVIRFVKKITIFSLLVTILRTDRQAKS